MAYFPKWYYNYSAKKCEKFIYGGCQGNANRFDTEIDCRVKCADTCTLPNHVGDIFCLAYFPRWWYNIVTKQCEPFIYGGCFGTRNNFKTEEACFNRCDKTGCDYVDCSKSPCPYGYKMTKKGCRNPKCACKCPCYKVLVFVHSLQVAIAQHAQAFSKHYSNCYNCNFLRMIQLYKQPIPVRNAKLSITQCVNIYNWCTFK